MIDNETLKQINDYIEMMKGDLNLKEYKIETTTEQIRIYRQTKFIIRIDVKTKLSKVKFPEPPKII